MMDIRNIIYIYKIYNISVLISIRVASWEIFIFLRKAHFLKVTGKII